MSRETDSSSSSFGGREPYGERPARAAAAEGPGAAAPEEKKTETTMTTRIRINIPGSRPIPPVVMREPVQDAAEPAAPEAEGPSPAPPEAPSETTASGGGSGKKTSSWFEPRKPPAAGGAARGETPAQGVPRPGTGTPPGGVPRSDTPYGGVPRADETPYGGVPRAGGTPSGGVPRGETPPGGSPVTDTPYGGVPRADDTPYGGVPRTDTPPGGTRGESGRERDGGMPPLPKRTTGASGARPPEPGGFHPPRVPNGPTAGPAGGDMPLPPAPGGERPGGMPMAPGAPEDIGSTTMDLGGPVPRPGPPGDRWVREDLPTAGPPGPPGAEAGGPGHLDDDPYGGPAVPPPGPRPPAAEHDFAPPAGEEPEPPARGRLRSRLTLVAVLVGGLLVLAYGAGLLLNQEEVPAGTTVLGHEIGGGTSQEAVNRLEAALGEPANADLTLVLDGVEVPLKPSVAGLTIDTEATVREAGSTDYNPVAVIGSLFGSGREVAPVFAVDEEKLTAALRDLAAEHGGEPVDGSISFENGVPTPHYGSPGVTVDVDSAAPAVEAAFRLRAETGVDEPIEVATATQEPAIGKAEVDRAMEEFAIPAMSGLVTVQAGGPGGPAVPLSPENSLRQFVSMEAVDGELVDQYDLQVLESLYGSTFAGVEIVRADGTTSPVTPQDVVAALRPALLETDPEKRIGVIDLDPS